MTEFLLAVIALGALMTAVLEVLLIVGLVRGLRRWSARIDRLRALIGPLSAHAQGIKRDLERSRSLAEGQAGRLAAFATTIEPSVRYGVAGVTAARAVAGLLLGRRSKWAVAAFVLRRLLR